VGVLVLGLVLLREQERQLLVLVQGQERQLLVLVQEQLLAEQWRHRNQQQL
jgi:hypothetical protein